MSDTLDLGDWDAMITDELAAADLTDEQLLALHDQVLDTVLDAGRPSIDAEHAALRAVYNAGKRAS